MTDDIEIYADIDDACKAQLDAIASSPVFSGQKIRIMPDAHSGVNSVIGFTSTIGSDVIPNIVSGDIGCGVLAVKLKRGKKGMDFAKLDKVIRSQVPFGVGSVNPSPIADFPYEELLCWGVLPNKHVIPSSLGSLGAGNHFIEVDEDPDGSRWLVVHSGSRNLGTKVAEYYQNMAGERIGSDIPDDIPWSMAWLSGDAARAYLHDMGIVCDFAARNRAEIAKSVIRGCGLKELGRIDTVHNYIDAADMILRKGAIAARTGERLIIPMNMARGCVVVEGVGNREWNCSAPHGAGRVMTRKEARESIPMPAYKSDMSGVWTSCVSHDTVDESPAAYKDPDSVIARLSETARVLFEMKAVYNFKSPSAK